ncbi:hypothetical protein, partial [Helicobacter typhlonius]|uniref:hypothetical protein n=1 Tax=Helicobacter typhlonius TaxID=76936 RepID=UPI002FE2271E
MNTIFKEPKFNESSFTCPHCGVLAQMVFVIPSVLKEKTDITKTALNNLKEYFEKYSEYYLS